MKEFWTTIQVAFAAIGGWLGWFLGGCDGLLYALLAFVVIDYITGIMCAIVDKRLSSAVGFKGIFKKVLIFAIVGIGHIIDTQVIGSGSVLRTAVIFPRCGSRQALRPLAGALDGQDQLCRCIRYVAEFLQRQGERYQRQRGYRLRI